MVWRDGEASIACFHGRAVSPKRLQCRGMAVAWLQRLAVNEYCADGIDQCFFTTA